jgi:hypothetical protein
MAGSCKRVCHDIAADDVLAVFVPDMRVEAVVDHDVVFHHAEEPFAVLEAAAQEQIVIDR